VALFSIKFSKVALFYIIKNKTETLRAFLFDFDWLQAKLNATDVTTLIADYVSARR